MKMASSLLAFLAVIGVGAQLTAAMPASVGVPGVDFAVGRTNVTPMSIAYLETKPLVGFSTTSVTIPAVGAAATVQFTVAPAYLGTFVAGSVVTIVSTSTLNAYLSNGKNYAAYPIGYVFGTVSAWDPVARLLSVYVAAGTALPGYGVSPSIGAYGNSTTAPAGRRGQTFSDWQLNTHVPAGCGPNAIYNGVLQEYVVFDTTTGSVNVTDWDWRGCKAGFQSKVGANLFPLKFSQCRFNIANIGENYFLAAYFAFQSNQPFSIDHCSGLFDWRSQAVQAKVVAALAPGGMVIQVDKVPAQGSAYLSVFDDPTTLINNGWRVVNMTNPSSMLACRIRDVDAVANTVSIWQYQRFDTRPDNTGYTVKTAALSPAGGNKLYVPAANVVGSTTQNIYKDTQIYLQSIRPSLNPNAEIFLGNVTDFGSDGTGSYVVLDRNLKNDVAININVNTYSIAQGNGGLAIYTTAAAAVNDTKLYVPLTRGVNGGPGGQTTTPLIYQGTALSTLVKNANNVNVPTLLGIVASTGSDAGGTFVTLDRPLSMALASNLGLTFINPEIVSTLQVGDTLAFFPQNVNRQGGYGNLNSLLTGVCTSFDHNDFDCYNDFLNAFYPLSTPTPISITNCRIGMMGLADAIHSDVWQHYCLGPGLNTTFYNNYFCWGYPIGDRNFGDVFGYGNPRDVTIGQKLAPLMSDVLFDRLFFDNRPAIPIGTLFYDSDTNNWPIIGTRANANGTTRVTFGNYGALNKGGQFILGDRYAFGGSANPALNGSFPALAFAPNYLAPQYFNTTFLSPGGGTKLYLPATVLVTTNVSVGCILLQGTTVLGGVTAVGTDSTGAYAQLDTALTADIAAAVQINSPQWIDVSAPYAADPVPSVSVSTNLNNTVLLAANNIDTIPVVSTAGILPGMMVTPSAGYPFATHTFVKQVIDGTHVQLTKPLQNNIGSTNITIKFSTWINPCAVALKRVSNIAIGYRQQASVSDTEDQFLFQSSLQAGMSIENITDLQTGAPLNFRLVPFGLINPVANWFITKGAWYNPRLPAVTGLSVTKVSANSFTLNFNAVTNAGSDVIMYAYSLDSGNTWSNDRIAGTGYILPGAVISGVSSGSIQVRAMNAANDLGFAVNPGLPSLPTAFNLAS